MKPNWGDEFTPRVAADMRALFANGITFRDNMNCAIITFDAKTATENVVANPLSSKPIVFIPGPVESITAVGGVSDGTFRELAAVPKLNNTRADGYLGITVQFTSGTWGRVSGILVGG